MENMMISDMTMVKASETKNYHLTFREKLELAKLLDALGVSVIELEGIQNAPVDTLCIKSIAGLVQFSTVAVPVSLFPLNAANVWNALQGARHARLQVTVPVSTVQMEYAYHKKPQDMCAAVAEAVAACKTYTDDVEFIARDATRSDYDFLCGMLNTAIESGARTVTVCDTAGIWLPSECRAFIEQLRRDVPALENVTLGVSLSDELAMADACAVAAARAGAGEIKVTSLPLNAAFLGHVAKVLAKREDICGVHCPVRVTELNKRIRQIADLCVTEKDHPTLFENGVQESEATLTAHDSKEDVLRIVEKLGYDLSAEDMENVWTAFSEIIGHKEEISSKELDAIIASHAMQVPAAYRLQSFLITSSNVHGSTAHVVLDCKGEELNGLSTGDGPIDAAYRAIEKVIGCHYELDDFQISSVTGSREAMGETVTKLRHNGKIYSGRGISTDITASGIYAYINALNKIVYEEDFS